MRITLRAEGGAHSSRGQRGMTSNSRRTHAPLRETLEKLLTQIIVSNRRNRIHRHRESMKMVSDIKRCTAGKRTVRKKIPKHFAKTKDRGIHRG